MEAAIQVVWWIGLVGALAATAVVLKQVRLILRTLGDIHRLAEATREAAAGIAGNTAEAPRLAAVEPPAAELRRAAAALAEAAGTLERKLGAPAADAARGG